MSLKPCPFCGNKMSGYPDYTITFKRDKKKVYGVYHEICTLKCNRCTCAVHQAGATRDEAEQNVFNLWNKRAEPQRKKGRWYKPKEYPRDSYRYICTNCHDVAYFVTGNNGKKHKEENPKCGYRFCPNCGAEMVEGETDA